MARVIARKPGAHKSEGTSIAFKKDPDTGLYRKIEHDTRTYHLEHKTKKTGKPRVSDEWYELGSENDWEFKFDVTGINGEPHTIYFRQHKES
jgi:hypothetical protein